MEINEKIAVEHGLKAEEYKKICELLKRVPNITELGIFSAMWNEHCSYKSSRLHLKTLKMTCWSFTLLIMKETIFVQMIN